jgi:hypothetical protein
MRRIVAAAIGMSLLPVVPALAQSPADIIACATIARDAERLACYDAAVANSSAEARAASKKRAEESARIAAREAAEAAAAAKIKAEADAAALAKAKLESFGAEGVASRSAERFEPDPRQLQELEATNTEVLTNRSGLGVFLLDNGQVWKQADTVSLPNVRVGDKVRIQRVLLGGYKLFFVRQNRATPVKRIQ